MFCSHFLFVRLALGVTHLVTSSKWLSNNRSSVEHLFVQAEMSTLRAVVSYEWIPLSLDHGSLVRGKCAIALPNEYTKAKERSRTLLSNNVLFFHGRYDVPQGNMKESKSQSSAQKESKGSLGSTPLGRLTLEKRDLIVLAALHGAAVVDVLHRSPLLLGHIGVHRGYCMSDLYARAVCSLEQLQQFERLQPLQAALQEAQYEGDQTMLPSRQQLAARVVVSSEDSLSRLALEIYAQHGLRPILAQGLIAAIQNQDWDSKERYEVFGVAK